MSSGDDDNDNQALGQESKKRRIQRACDVCRRKKIRCDGGQMPQNRCSNCLAYNLECTYVEAAKKRGPPKGYVESLENRLEKMEQLLSKLSPETDLTKELGTLMDRDSWQKERRQSDKIKIFPQFDNRCNPSALITSAAPSKICPAVNADDLPPSDDELAHGMLSEGLKRLTIGPLEKRFHGKSSGVMLVRTAIDLKREFVGGDDGMPPFIPPNRRKEFWETHPWELKTREFPVQYEFPPDDLLLRLVDNFFTYVNPFLPILHRPTFERAIADRLHHADCDFGSVLMLVCAIGSRWSDDPRVLLEGECSFSAGFKWFDEVQNIRKSLLGPPRLYDIQTYALSSIFLHGSSAPQASWTMVGIGIHLAQDVGAHRRKAYNSSPTVESELWKRAFWVLVALDRTGSTALGRPCAIQDEDFDLDSPIEVDDEYWEGPTPELAFKQPPGIPSNISFFISLLKLQQILSFALRTIYSINKSKILLGFVGPQWEQHIVAELDSALNKWIDTVPEHLRWDPHRENLLHFAQSATLYATYYHLQILIHRPFIPNSRNPSPLTFPSLAICTNAARSCSHVADIERVVLLLNIWGAKKSGLNVEPAAYMEDVQKCMQVLRAIERRWQSAGRLWDILHELAFVGDIPIPQPTGSPHGNNKREREADSPKCPSAQSSPMSDTLPSPADSAASLRPIAGRKQGSSSFSPTPGLPTPQSPPLLQPGALPFGSNQLAQALNINVLMNPPSSWFSAPLPDINGTSPGTSGVNSSNRLSQSPFTMNGGGASSSGTAPAPAFFDLFQSEPQLLANMPLGDSAYTMQGGVPEYNGNRAQVASDAFLAEMGGPSEATMLMNSEALQMWSAVPASFDLDDWGSYLNNVSGPVGMDPPPGMRKRA